MVMTLIISFLVNISKRAWRILYGKLDDDPITWKENECSQDDFQHEALAKRYAISLKMEERRAFKLC